MIDYTNIAVELGKAPESVSKPVQDQWQAWIDRAYRTISRRADRVGVDLSTLDQEAVDDAVTLVVSAQAAGPGPGVQSVSDRLAVDDGSLDQTRRYGYSTQTIEDALADLWDDLGLSGVTAEHWSGSIGYVR